MTRNEKVDFIKDVKPLLRPNGLTISAENLDILLHLCEDILLNLSSLDRDSIGSNAVSANAKKFLHLLDFLNNINLTSPESINQPLNFWCGEVGKIKALQTPNEISDSEVPAIAMLFAITEALQRYFNGCTAQIVLLNSTISRAFALHAKDIVNVYLTSEKTSEYAGMTVGNAFWEAELPILMNLYHAKVIQDIRIHLYDHHKNEWQAPRSLISAEGETILIRRRNAHPTDAPHALSLFKSSNMSTVQREAWKLSSERPAIPYGRLHFFAKQWRDKAACNNKPGPSGVICNRQNIA